MASKVSPSSSNSTVLLMMNNFLFEKYLDLAWNCNLKGLKANTPNKLHSWKIILRKTLPKGQQGIMFYWMPQCCYKPCHFFWSFLVCGEHRNSEAGYNKSFQSSKCRGPPLSNLSTYIPDLTSGSSTWLRRDFMVRCMPVFPIMLNNCDTWDPAGLAPLPRPSLSQHCWSHDGMCKQNRRSGNTWEEQNNLPKGDRD